MNCRVIFVQGLRVVADEELARRSRPWVYTEPGAALAAGLFETPQAIDLAVRIAKDYAALKTLGTAQKASWAKAAKGPARTGAREAARGGAWVGRPAPRPGR